MSTANTPMPGEDPGAVPDDQPEKERDPVTEMDVEANPQPEPDSSLPPDDDPDSDQADLDRTDGTSN